MSKTLTRKRWIFTSWVKPTAEYYLQIAKAISEGKATMVVLGHEYTRDGLYHQQGYITHTRPLKNEDIPLILGLPGKTWRRRAKGSHDQCIRYCIKTGAYSVCGSNGWMHFEPQSCDVSPESFGMCHESETKKILLE